MMRKRSKLSGALAIVVITATGGCMVPWTPIRSASSAVSVIQDTSSVSHAEPASANHLVEPLEPNAEDVPKTTDEAMAAVLDELQQIGAVDHAAQQRLMAELREAKPEDWPGMVEQFQSALAFREQLVAKESQIAEESTASSGVTQVSSVSSDSVYAPKGNGAIQPVSATAERSHENEIPQAISSMVVNATASREALSKHVARASAELVPPPLNPPLERKPTMPAATERVVAEQSGYVAPVVYQASAGSSEEHLQAAITSMEQSTQEPPSSVEDVQQHMRLGLLRLLAGQESAAVSPIPGASSTQQDYWSKQLFAISTYLDSQQQPDVKRRAAGSLMHLDSARASLAELATLQVRNLTFVDSVEGFGAYRELEETKFRPGDQVTLYTEVENFRSRSTKEGFHTQLSTSYEVLDSKGTRVDGAQFPDVEDLCKNQRRDFHMQYGVALPTQIYAGNYQLRLTITDQTSHKIGQTSVSFEIVE